MPQQASLPNFNAKTGYPYGVIIGHSCPELVDDIFSYGDDISWEAAVKEVKDAVRQAVQEAVSPYVVGEERLAKRVVDILEDELGDFLETPEESEYFYSEKLPQGEIKYQLGWLGGAPHVWVLESPFLAWCRPCSPCVPGAGDLDSLTDRNGGILVHSVPPDCFPEEVQAKLKQEKEDGYVVLWLED